MGWSGYNLEPVPWIFEQLGKNRPNSRNLHFGLSNCSGHRRFQSVIHPQFGRDTTIGAIAHSPSLQKMLTEIGCTFEEIEINVRSWSDFVESEKITDIDLMVLDVEGHEISVLEGMIGSRVLPHIMCIEFGHIGFEKLRSTMVQLGYEYDIHSFANAFFIRKDKVALFELRACKALQKSISTPHTPTPVVVNDPVHAQMEGAINALQAQVQWLQQREQDLVTLLDTIKRSKGWRALELLKGALYFIRPNCLLRGKEVDIDRPLTTKLNSGDSQPIDPRLRPPSKDVSSRVS